MAVPPIEGRCGEPWSKTVEVEGVVVEPGRFVPVLTTPYVGIYVLTRVCASWMNKEDARWDPKEVVSIVMGRMPGADVVISKSTSRTRDLPTKSNCLAFDPALMIPPSTPLHCLLSEDAPGPVKCRVFGSVVDNVCD